MKKFFIKAKVMGCGYTYHNNQSDIKLIEMNEDGYIRIHKVILTNKISKEKLISLVGKMVLLTDVKKINAKKDLYEHHYEANLDLNSITETLFTLAFETYELTEEIENTVISALEYTIADNGICGDEVYEFVSSFSKTELFSMNETELFTRAFDYFEAMYEV